MNIYLKPKNIIVVGGATGIGFGIVKTLLEKGAKNIIIASRSINKLENAQKLLKNDKIKILKFDITDVSNHLSFIEKANKLIGTVPDGLVVSSGINASMHNWKGFNVTEEEYDKVMNTNLKGVFFLIRNFANYLYERKVDGNICIISSISAHRDLLSSYQVSKNAISGIVRCYGKHLCERGIVLNCVEPGVTEDGLLGGLKDFSNGIRGGKPWSDNSIQRVIRPEEIAEIVYILMSNIGEVMSGSCILAGGGAKSIH